jgi:hypothetical protein
VEVDENTSPPGGSNSNAQSKRSRISKGGGGKKKKQAAVYDFDYEDYDSVVDCIKNYKAEIVDLETQITQLREHGKTIKQQHKNGELSRQAA